MKASWQGVTIAQSNKTTVVEGNHYFPPDDVDMKYLVPSKTKTKCSWKGVANYYTISVDDQLNRDACWFYAKPKKAAKHIQGYIAFWRGVEVR